MTRLLILPVLAALAAMSLPAAAAPIRHVIVIAMENKDAEKESTKSEGYIYGNDRSAPYLNGELARQGARALNFNDGLPGYNSEPHYIVMEAGTHSFADTTFTCDNDPDKSCNYLFGTPNWTSSPDHLTAQLEAASPPLSWMTYQEDIDPKTTGACPVNSAGTYAAKHNPFVFFSDIAGSPPSADNAHCIAHTRDLSRFSADMRAGKLANYVFITPNLCHDMHGTKGCRDDTVAQGDGFLKSFLPPVIDWARMNDAVVFVVWDEGRKGLKIPFYAAGAGVKAGHESKVDYSHRSVVKTIGRIFGLPPLDAVKSANDLGDMFEPGALP
jgi:hypothetical protein